MLKHNMMLGKLDCKIQSCTSGMGALIELDHIYHDSFGTEIDSASVLLSMDDLEQHIVHMNILKGCLKLGFDLRDITLYKTEDGVILFMENGVSSLYRVLYDPSGALAIGDWLDKDAELFLPPTEVSI